MTVVGWESSGDSAFIRPCLAYNQTTGQFRVFQDGIYVVISHLAFVGPSTTADIYAQKVMRSGFSEPILIDMQRGGDLPAGSAPVHISVAVGVARLRVDQLIYVVAKPVDKVSRVNRHSYFSLVKLQRG